VISTETSNLIPPPVPQSRVVADQGRPPQLVLVDLLESSLVLPEDYEALPPEVRADLEESPDLHALLAKLVERRLLTPFQADRLAAGKAFGLVLGSYRILDKVSSGGMGVVFRGEHVRLRRPVAIKVLPMAGSRAHMDRVLRRFYAEVRAVAQLHHPHIVRALDAGAAVSDSPDGPVLHYYVMEYIEGEDLDDYVKARGPLPVGQACAFAHQIAGALAQAHEHRLVHRDVKPSNILVTKDGAAKLVDFGLVRHFRQRMTERGALLGTLDFMAPEQARDASAVDGRADLYGLGGTLYYCLTGQRPFRQLGDLAQEMAARQTQPPPSARAFRPEVTKELDAVIAKLMACRPQDRYQLALEAMAALAPFLPSASPRAPARTDTSTSDTVPPRKHRVLVVDDDVSIRRLCVQALKKEAISCDEAADGPAALNQVWEKPYDLVLVDWAMPGMNGLELCRSLRERPPARNLKVIMISGNLTADDLSQVLPAGADDYLPKPFSLVQMLARVKAALRAKDREDETDQLNLRLLSVNKELEQNLSAREHNVAQSRQALIAGLARLVAQRGAEAPGHLRRIPLYVRELARTAVRKGHFTDEIDETFLQLLEACAPLHDLGKVSLPDYILLKPGRLDEDERRFMQTHTVTGADMLKELAEQHGSAMDFLPLASAVARHHHERFNGSGYPDSLKGDAIPLAARIVAVADVYDALRTRRVYKPALSHAAALQVILEACAAQFDPRLLEALRDCATGFDRIYRENPDNG
jgi:response regulator RpfG family c-di-GMP phosphodiesterase